MMEKNLLLNPHHEQINKELLSCVERSLDFMDESAKTSVFWHLKNEFGIDKDEIILRPDEFILALRKTFGPGSFVLEDRISKEICREFSITQGSGVKSFRDLVSKVVNGVQ